MLSVTARAVNVTAQRTTEPNQLPKMDGQDPP